MTESGSPNNVGQQLLADLVKNLDLANQAAERNFQMLQQLLSVMNKTLKQQADQQAVTDGILMHLEVAQRTMEILGDECDGRKPNWNDILTAHETASSEIFTDDDDDDPESGDPDITPPRGPIIEGAPSRFRR